MRTVLAFQITERFNKNGARKELKRLYQMAKKSDISTIQVSTFLELVHAEASAIKSVGKLSSEFIKLGAQTTITAKLLNTTFEVFQKAMDEVQFILPNGDIVVGYENLNQ